MINDFVVTNMGLFCIFVILVTIIGIKFFRLFVGMGIIWYFEILAFFIDDDADHKWLYLGDVLNMLQVIHTILL